MAQSFTQIQQALDAKIVTVAGITSANLITENVSSNFAMQPDITSKMAVRTTLVSNKTSVETIGNTGYVKVSGLYVVDILAAQNIGYATPKALGDLVLAAFPRGLILTLGNGDTITVLSSYPSVRLTEGAKAMNKLYLTQYLIEWFGYVTP